MTLRKKTLILIGVTLLVLIGVLYATSQIILLRGFVELEEQNTHQNVERARDVLFDDISNLDSLTFDWAAWDDTYAFIEDVNDEYIDSNLVDETFPGIRLNLMIFTDSSDSIVYGKAYDLQNEEEIPIPQGFLNQLSANDFLLQHLDTESSITGIVLLPEGPMLVASRPIITSEEEGPIRGTLIMGRYLDSAEIEHLAGITHLSLTVRRFDDSQMSPDFQAVVSSLSEEEPILVRPLSEQSIAGYVLLKDVYGKPALVLRADMPRGIYEQGQATVSYFILLLLAVGLVFGLVIMLLLEKTVLSRLARLSASVSSIGSSRDLSARVSMTGNDELSSLAGAINGMLEGLEQSQTERKKAEEKMRQQQEELQIILDSVPALVFYKDKKDRFIRVNEALAQAFSMSKEEIVGKTAVELSPGKDYWEDDKKVMETGIPLRNIIEPFETPEGTKWAQTDKVPYRDSDGNIIGIIGFAVDITERKKAENELKKYSNELEQSNKLKDLFIDIMRHDLLNPTTVVKGVAETALRSEEDSDKKEALQIIHESNERIIDLIENASLLARLESLEKLEFEAIDLATILRKAAKEATRLADEKNMKIKVPADGVFEVLANPLIQSVFSNLLSNAIKYGPENSDVVVGLEEDGPKWKVSVADNGPGIPDENKKAVFDRFKRIEKGPVKGTGLGLTIVKKVVEAHKGRVWVEGNPKGGSIFYVNLPKKE